MGGSNDLAYWKWRAMKYRKRSVLNLGHAESEIEAVTRRQKQEIFPHFRKMLLGHESLLLDFGCGSGRFTADLAATIGGQAIGVDPVETLIKIAPIAPNVEYRVLESPMLPFPDNHFDIVWVCLVLGGMNGNAIEQSAAEIKRVLRLNGLLFLIENTSNKPDVIHWRYRQMDEYQQWFPFVKLLHLHDYHDLDERISLLAGRRVV